MIREVYNESIIRAVEGAEVGGRFGKMFGL